MTATQTQGSGAVQAALWGAAAEEWASLMEPQGRALFDAVLAHGRFVPGAEVLDIGCGSGLFVRLIAARGCHVTGFDAAEPLLAIARRSMPAVSFHLGDMQTLPFTDEHFDIVTGINAFQYAADPRHALVEARRVAKRGAQIFVATWGLPQACEAAAYLAALKPLLPPLPPGAPGPFALSDEAALRSLVASAGLTPVSVADVDVTWQFGDLDTALAAMLSAGPSVLAIQASGRDRVQATLQQAIAPFRLANGAYRLENRFRSLLATRD
jgi:2-polyprenyl-3-methyl-5-hydroxy-6-metoxy-1,4-benzoquinol methylase